MTQVSRRSSLVLAAYSLGLTYFTARVVTRMSMDALVHLALLYTLAGIVLLDAFRSGRSGAASRAWAISVSGMAVAVAVDLGQVMDGCP